MAGREALPLGGGAPLRRAGRRPLRRGRRAARRPLRVLLRRRSRRQALLPGVRLPGRCDAHVRPDRAVPRAAFGRLRPPGGLLHRGRIPEHGQDPDAPLPLLDDARPGRARGGRADGARGRARRPERAARLRGEERAPPRAGGERSEADGRLAPLLRQLVGGSLDRLRLRDGRARRAPDLGPDRPHGRLHEVLRAGPPLLPRRVVPRPHRRRGLQPPRARAGLPLRLVREVRQGRPLPRAEREPEHDAPAARRRHRRGRHERRAPRDARRDPRYGPPQHLRLPQFAAQLQLPPSRDAGLPGGARRRARGAGRASPELQGRVPAPHHALALLVRRHPQRLQRLHGGGVRARDGREGAARQDGPPARARRGEVDPRPRL